MVRKYNTTLECQKWSVETEYCDLVETEHKEEIDCGQDGLVWRSSPDCKKCPEVTEENCRYRHINCLRQDPFIVVGLLEECGPDQNTRKLRNKSADN